MFLRFLSVAALAGLGFVPAPAQAQEVLDQAKSCIFERFEAQQQPTECIETAHVACLTVDEGTPLVAVVCFREQADMWNGGIRDLMVGLNASAPQDIALIAGIETKYDILSALMQCDRINELALAVSDETAEVIQRQKAQCDAMAAGLAYARLAWRVRDMQ